MPLHYAIRITGRVQGVGYRASAWAEAERLGLRGFICNEPNGSVYAEAEGEREQLDRFLAWCRQGPSHARVENVVREEREPQGFPGFRIR